MIEPSDTVLGSTLDGRGLWIVLNGVPRSGKSSLAAALAVTLPGPWILMGVDASLASMPESLRPGIGLRPGGERPDLEPVVEREMLRLYGEAAEAVAGGSSVLMDIGHHDDYSRPLGLLPRCAAVAAPLGAILVGVRCSVEEVRRRREQTNMIADDAMLRRWDQAVHHPGIYDLEVDTTAQSSREVAGQIAAWLKAGHPPSACFRLMEQA